MKVTFVYSLVTAGHVKIIIYNTAGMDVAEIDTQGAAIDNNKAEFQAAALAPGAYYYVIKVIEGAKTQSYKPGKFLVIR